MKENYENRSKTYLTRRVPCVLRLDGKAMHTFTKGFRRPYDEIFHTAMNETMKYLCENIQGCKIGYTQSDEITLVLQDFDTPTTDAWFDYSVQKMCSIAASMATFVFNRVFLQEIEKYSTKQDYDEKYYNTLKNASEKGAFFDCRCFSVPEDEVVNCLIWRQQDATRNAIQMLGQTYFSQKALNKKNNNDIQDMLMLEKKINFNDMPAEFKRGICCVRREVQNPNIDIKDGVYLRKKWVLDKEIPIFTKDREYIEKELKQDIV